MTDPSPVVGLPDCEYIELYNSGDIGIQIKDWKIKGGSCDCVMPEYVFPAKSYLLIASTTAKNKLDTYCKTFYLPCFPTLNNEGKSIWLTDSARNVRDIVSYSDTWFDSEIKSGGGWSLERKDASLNCSCSQNWKASSNATGGSPGSANSVVENVTLPASVALYTGNITDSTVTIYFSSPMDSSSLLNVQNYSFDHGFAKPLASSANFPFYNSVTLQIPSLLQPEEMYRVTCSSAIQNCDGQPIVSTELRFALPVKIEKGDVVINEVMFNPEPGNEDFIELFNNSQSVIDAGTIVLSNVENSTGEIKNAVRICKRGRLFFSGEYLLITPDTQKLCSRYSIPREALLFEANPFPSYPDKEGQVLITDAENVQLDKFAYSESMHTEQLKTTEGVSLEKINPRISSSEKSNWHSASWSCGFATPGKQNSQFMTFDSSAVFFDVIPKTFSPDNDGKDDFVTFRYSMPSDGYIASLQIYSINGNRVRTLAKNSTINTVGDFYWDATDDTGNMVSNGMYIVLFSAYNISGDKKQSKQTCVVMSK